MEPIAIVGMACRFPAAASLTDYWKLLSEGRDGVGEVPADRWDAAALYDADPKAPGKTNTREGGFIEDIDRFDAAFFGISPREAVQMDPQQRILLELAHEAFEDAGIAPAALAGSDTAVYIGAMSNDYLHHQTADDLRRIDVHTGGGAGFCMLANRLSYQFDLHGPSMAIDSACSSSLVTVFQACQSLWAGETSLALAGGINLMLSPAFNVFYAKAGLSAPDGRCKTFSAQANGIGRGEGAGLIVLKRQCDALNDGDPIYAVIRGGALNHGGRSNGVTAPNRWAQENLVRGALRHAGVRGDELHYVELHGTGTYIGDPIEANALGTVLIEQGRRTPCLVGSVKSNIGHLEGAAGVAGLIKLALSLHHRCVPASLWFDTPNPVIDFETLPLAVNTQRRTWPLASSDETALAGISSFGLGGTNAHLVLASAPAGTKRAAHTQDKAGHLLVAGARSDNALRAVAQQYLALLSDGADIAALCAAAMKRDLHDHRLHVRGSDRQALIAGLQDYLAGRDSAQIVAGRLKPHRRAIRIGVPEVVDISPASVARWLGHAPQAANAWRDCRETLATLGDDRLPSLADFLNAPTPDDAATRALYLFAVQYAQLQQLLALLPGAVALVPSGRGQLAACCAAGALSLTQALDWLKRDLMRPAPATAAYRVPCECADGINPDLDALDWTHDEPAWRQRLAADNAALQLILNSNGERVVDDVLHAMPPEDNSFLHFLAALGQRAHVAWRRLAVTSASKLPAYPWQRESYWLPRPDRDPAPADAPPTPIEADDGTGLRSALAALPPAERETRLVAYLRERVAAALHMPLEDVAPAQPVDTLGMDSLTAVEIKNRIERDLRVTVPVVKFLNGDSVADFAAFLLMELAANPASHVSADVASAPITPVTPGTPVSHVASSAAAQPQSDAVLSVTQERIWQLDQFSPGNPVYNFQSAVSLEGPLDHAALQRAATHVVTRHDTLRTRYGTTLGKPDVAVSPTLAFTIERIDWRALDAGQQSRELQSAATAAAQTRFDLSSPPLFKLQCFCMSDTRHVLVLTMHHIVSDLLSLDLFVEELSAHYGLESGQQGGNPPVRNVPDATYQDHARLQRSDRSRPPPASSVDFWRKLLTDAPDTVWNSDFPRPAQPAGNAATLHLTIDADTVTRIEALARQERVTPFVVLLSAFFLLQNAANDQDDQVIAMPSAGRASEETASLIGMFSTPLPMRADLARAHTVRAFLQQVRQMVLGVTEHAAVPFADLVDIARSASGGRALTLRSMFSFVSRMRPLAFPGLTLRRVPTDRGISDFDLFLTLYRDGDCWRGAFEYSTELFSAQTAQDWADAYAAIVGNIASRLDAPPRDLVAAIPRPRALQIAISATFTADTLADTAAFWQHQLRWPVQIAFAPYNQVFQTLLDPSGEFHRPNTLNVLLIRPEDWVRYTDDCAQRDTALAQIAREFVDVVRQTRLKAPLAIYLCPRGPDTANSDALARAEAVIEDNLAGVTGVTVFRAESALARHALGDIHDAHADEIGHIPFTSAWFVAMGTELVRRASSLQRPPCKVIALDCDNTLWRGVCGEEGAQGVDIDAPSRALQQFVAAQAAAGVLLCLVSKNEKADVMRVFDQNAGMVLNREQIVAHRINWLPKSANLRSLAAELQLGLDSFVFIDDNPVECAEVRAACPEVLTLCLPADTAAIPAFLDHVWAFDRHEVSAEDRKRADSYLQNRRRESLRQESGSFSRFLAQLDLRVDVVPVDDENLLRVAQLSQRTNQFNSTGIRHDAAALRHALAHGLDAVAVSVHDRFGDYGLVGTVTFRATGTALLIEGFMLSCRVLGRGVEHRMLAEMGRIARARGVDTVLLDYKELPRNQPFRNFVAGLDGQWNESGERFCLSVDAASIATFNPELQTAQVDAAARDPASTAPSGVHLARQAALAEIAGSLRELNDVVARIEQGSRRRRRGDAGTPPLGETELAIAAIWRDALRIDALGRDDNFFEAGGNSLLLVQVNAGLIERFGQDIAITTLFQYPTIASLAQHLAKADDRADDKAFVQERATQAREQLQQRMQRLGNRRRR